MVIGAAIAPWGSISDKKRSTIIHSYIQQLLQIRSSYLSSQPSHFTHFRAALSGLTAFLHPRRLCHAPGRAHYSPMTHACLSVEQFLLFVLQPRRVLLAQILTVFYADMTCTVSVSGLVRRKLYQQQHTCRKLEKNIWL